MEPAVRRVGAVSAYFDVLMLTCPFSYTMRVHEVVRAARMTDAVPCNFELSHSTCASGFGSVSFTHT